MTRAGSFGLVISLAVGTLAGGLTAGCLDRELKPLVPCTVSGVARRVKVANVEKVDLLLMVDNSNSMTEEQASLTEQIPRMIRVLASGDTNGDMVQDFPPVKDLHVGVVTSDMGTGGFRVPTCTEPNFGDDGILRTEGNTAVGGCMATYPPFLGFMSMGGDPAAFATDVTCVARMGTGGCGFEQQLDAVLKALTPSTSGITFVMGTQGHGDRENMGFVRSDSLLVVLMLTDEEDCSAIDPGLFDPMSSTYTGDLNLRCFMYPAAVHQVSRYADGLLSLRAENPDLFIFAAITGVPNDLVTADGNNFQEILDDPAMQERVDTMSPTPRLVPSCNVPGRGIAFPPRRIVTLAKLISERESNGIVQSICQSDFTPALNLIIQKIADVLRGACLPRPLNRDASGLVNCDVVQVLPTEGDYTRCDQLGEARGVDPVPVRMDGTHQVCKVIQRATVGGVPTGGEGWFYDDFSDDVRESCPATPHRISFTGSASPITGSEVRLECLQPTGTVVGDATIGIGSPCGTPDACGGVGLTCDGMTNTCQQQCNSAADCPSSFECDSTRPLAGLAGSCVNPTCG